MYKAVMFDLDGTLLDTLTDLANAANTVMESQGFPTHPIEEYRLLVGDGLVKFIERSLPPENREPALMKQCQQLMKQTYATCWAENTVPYPGIDSMLDKLSHTKMPVAILSNKPDEFLHAMVAKILPNWEFAVVRGAMPDVPIKPDPTSALDVLGRLGVAPAECLYVGDTGTDVRTALNAGMVPVGVTWGFRDAQELIEAGAKAMLDRPDDLIALLS